jgi:hypothetical protein
VAVGDGFFEGCDQIGRIRFENQLRIRLQIGRILRCNGRSGENERQDQRNQWKEAS